MPEGYRKLRPYPGKAYTLKHAAEHHLLLLVRCRLCRKLVRYLAADLAELLGPDREAHLPPFPCSRCGTEDYIRVDFHQPHSGDYGHLYVRRPGPVRVTQTWVTVRLGDGAPPKSALAPVGVT